MVLGGGGGEARAGRRGAPYYQLGSACGDDIMAEEVSVFRLNLLRAMYLLNCILVGSGVVTQFTHRQAP
jgi:hypothetical protein